MKPARLFLCLAVVAAAARTSGAWGWSRRDRPEPTAEQYEKRLEKRTRKQIRIVGKALDLSDEQKQRIEEILKERNEALVGCEKEYRGRRAETAAKARGKVLEVLTPEQRRLYEEGSGPKGDAQRHDQDPKRYQGGGLHEL